MSARSKPRATRAAMRWLLEECKAGVELTHAGYLPTRLVSAAVERFFEADILGSPRSEADAHQLGALRETASRLGALTKRRRLLKTSTTGVRLLDDSVAMWHAIAANLDEGDAFSRMVSELIAQPCCTKGVLDCSEEATRPRA